MPLADTTFALALAVAAAAEPAPTPSPVPAGSWGGAHAQVEVTHAETRVELDCAHAVLPGVLPVGKDGAVDALGTLVRHGNGPVAATDAGEGEPARFRGTLAGKTLTLTVTLVGPSQDLGTFKLKQGRPGRLSACPG